jgi:peroxiredoxin
MKKTTLTTCAILLSLFLLSSFQFPGEPYSVGDKIDDFKLQNIDGTWVSLEDYKNDKGLIIIFTCNTCPVAQQYEDRIAALHEKYAPKGYPVVAINPNDPEIKPGDSYEQMKKRAKQKDFPFRYLFDAKQEVFPKFGATRTPHVFLVDMDRRLRYYGAIDDNSRDASMVKTKYLEDAITNLEKGNDPDPAMTKAVGCSIKFKST